MSKISPVKTLVTQLLQQAGIIINGCQPWDITVHNDAFYDCVLRGGSLALGESYIDGWWDVPQLDEFINRLLRARLHHKIKGDWHALLRLAPVILSNRQSRRRAWQVGERHYDIGNDLYQAMLDKRLTYTCGYWKKAINLDQAQEDKLNLTCRKLGLKLGMRVLDIGCGWGSFAKFAAEKYGVQVTGISVSKKQVALAKKSVAGLPVKILSQDYRDISGTYDRIVSLGMFEHVGAKNYRTYMRVIKKHLSPAGLFLLHTIGTPKTTIGADPWLEKYIFPNGKLPSVAQIAAAANGLFVLEDWHSFGQDYDRTLMAWWQNFDSAWPKLKANYNNRFYRMWRYYLLSCAGAFRARNVHLWQIIFSPPTRHGSYLSHR